MKTTYKNIKKEYIVLTILLFSIFILLQNKTLGIIVFINLSYLFYKLVLSLKYKPIEKEYTEVVTMIIPNYNERREVVYKSFISILNQSAKIERIVFVDDGSKNKEALEIVRDFKDSLDSKGIDLKIIEHMVNKGKKQALCTAIDYVDTDLVVLYDSDSFLKPNAIEELIKPFSDDEIGAVVGEVCIANNSNFITQIQEIIYNQAFNLSRAAQSTTGSVIVCSGAFTAYRTKILKENKEKLLQKKFGIFNIGAGDDRRLTSITLSLKYNTIYQETAKVYTNVPTTLKQFINQQIRWVKTSLIMAMYSIKNIAINIHIPLWEYMETYMWAVNFIMLLRPAFYIFSVSSFSINGLVLRFFQSLIYYILLYGISGIHYYKKFGMKKYLLGWTYQIIYTILLLYIRVKAILTINNEKWNTR